MGSALQYWKDIMDTEVWHSLDLESRWQDSASRIVSANGVWMEMAHAAHRSRKIRGTRL